MLCFIHPDRWLSFGTPCERLRSASPLLLANPEPLPERERLRHLLIGSPAGVRSAIHTLHKLRYADQSSWSQLITIPASGILITPAQGEVLSLLRRDSPRPTLEGDQTPPAS